MPGSGNNLNRASSSLLSEIPSLPQCLPLEPIILGNKKHTRSGELKKVLGVPPGFTEDHSFGTGHLKPSAPVATEELKHFKESVQDATKKARDRVKMLRRSLFKLDKYREALSSKKRQFSEILSSEKPCGESLTKVGSQIHRNATTQRVEDRAKSAGLSKRVRTSVVDVRAESRSASNSRRQVFNEKDSDMVQSLCANPDRTEEKTLKLLAGGEGLDQKIKKKRSVGSVGNRVINGEREIKRTAHLKVNSDSRLRSCDAQSYRIKTSPGVGGVNRLDGSSEPSSSDARMVLKNELENAPSLKVVVAKGNKANIQKDNSANRANTLLKGKISRAQRIGSIMGLDLSHNAHSPIGIYQGSEPASLSKAELEGVTNHQKDPLSTGSSIYPITKWIGQRPHKISRTRRTNLASPVSNHDETQIPSQGVPSCDFSARTFATNESPSVDNSTRKLRKEVDDVSSPFGMSQSEESGAGGYKLKQKDADGVKVGLTAAHEIGSFVSGVKKNKILTNDMGDGVRRQGRSGRGVSMARSSIPLTREKSESIIKPLHSMRASFEKNKSKSGRPPSKKLKDRKALTRIPPHCESSDFTGEFEDDQEELFLAANSARTASNLACSGPFWKKIEYIFASLSSEDTVYLNQQMRFSEELDETLSQMLGVENVLGVVRKYKSNCHGERKGNHYSKESRSNDVCRKFDMGRADKVTSLYQRLLSALIQEHESDEYHCQSEGKNMFLQCASDDSHCGSCNQIESEAESGVDFQSQKSCIFDRFSYDKSAAFNSHRNQSVSSSIYSSELLPGDDDFSRSDVGHVGEICSNDFSLLQTRESHAPGLSSDCQYQLMCLDDRLILELQSIGLHPETLPELAEGEDLLDQDIVELKEGLYQQIGRKKKKLGKVDRSVQKGSELEKQQVERVAMDQLVEVAYRKRLACQGNSGSKSAVRKVSRQAALGFIRRTLARCQKFEDTGISCFSDPAMQDVILSVPPAKSVDCVGSGTASNTFNETSHQRDARGSGTISSTFEKYDSPSDTLDKGSMNKSKKREVRIDEVVASASSRASSTLPLGMKGKRSERNRDQNRDVLRTNSFSATGRSSLDSLQNEQKTKSKPKLKNDQSLANVSNKVREPSKEVDDVGVDDLHELDPMAELDVSNELGDWLNFDEDSLQDLDTIGLEIPTDDLSDLNMLI